MFQRKGSTTLVVTATILLVGVVTSQAAFAATRIRIYDGSTGTNRMARAFLTPDGHDLYAISKSAGVVTMRALSSNRDANHREAYWPVNEPDLTDSEVCATWSTASSNKAHEGLAFRVIGEPGRTRAVTVTKNVFFAYYATINVGVWDTDSRKTDAPIAAYDMKAVLEDPSTNALKPFPWRICARVQGKTLTFKIWLPTREREPSWTNPVHARTTHGIPAGHLAAGKTGWYIGHIPPGGRVQYSGLGIWSLGP
jgi:hypothetical protein